MKTEIESKIIRPVFYAIFCFTLLCHCFAASDIVAKVGGETITRSDLLNEMASSATAPDTTGADLNTRKQKVLDNMIDQKILVMEATAEKINVDPKTVEQYYQNEIMAAGNDEKFKKRLKQLGMNEKQFRQNLVDQLKVRTMLQTNVYMHLKPLTLTEAENYFKTHAAEFTTGDRVRFRYIYISTSKETTAESKSAKLAKAQKALDLLKAGEEFPKIVQDYSETSTNGYGGDVGRYIRPGELYSLPEVEKVVFSLDSGKTSDLITTKYGYFIVQIIDKEVGHLRSFEQVKSQILEELNKEQAENRYNEWFDGIKSKYPIEIHPENF